MPNSMIFEEILEKNGLKEVDDKKNSKYYLQREQYSQLQLENDLVEKLNKLLKFHIINHDSQFKVSSRLTGIYKSLEIEKWEVKARPIGPTQDTSNRNKTSIWGEINLKIDSEQGQQYEHTPTISLSLTKGDKHPLLIDLAEKLQIPVVTENLSDRVAATFSITNRNDFATISQKCDELLAEYNKPTILKLLHWLSSLLNGSGKPKVDNTHSSILPPANITSSNHYTYYSSRAVEKLDKARLAGPQAALSFNEAEIKQITEQLATELCPISSEKLISYRQEEEAIVTLQPGQPITAEQLQPFVLVKNGKNSQGNNIYQIYKREAIENWLKKQSKNPFTREPLLIKDLIPLNEKNVDFQLINQLLDVANTKAKMNEVLKEPVAEFKTHSLFKASENKPKPVPSVVEQQEDGDLNPTALRQ